MGYVEYEGIGDILVYIEERESWSTFWRRSTTSHQSGLLEKSVKKIIVRAQATNVAD